jgi:hypothetical protein
VPECEDKQQAQRMAAHHQEQRPMAFKDFNAESQLSKRPARFCGR